MAARRNTQTTCDLCDRPFYARRLCKNCYMRTHRKSFGKSAEKAQYNEDDLADLWSFVKKELNIG